MNFLKLFPLVSFFLSTVFVANASNKPPEKQSPNFTFYSGGLLKSECQCGAMHCLATAQIMIKNVECYKTIIDEKTPRLAIREILSTNKVLHINVRTFQFNLRDIQLIHAGQKTGTIHIHVVHTSGEKVCYTIHFIERDPTTIDPLDPTEFTPYQPTAQ